MLGFGMSAHPSNNAPATKSMLRQQSQAACCIAKKTLGKHLLQESWRDLASAAPFPS
jgi:hypothetical protein